MPTSAKQAFLQTVGGLLPPGHRFLKAAEAFHWHRAAYTEIFCVRVVDRSRVVELGLGLSFPEVESLFHEAWPIAPEFWEGSFTIATPIEAIDPSLQTIRAPVDRRAFAEPAAAISAVFDAHASSYFEKYSTLAAVDILLNENPERKSVHCPVAYRGAFGIIVAAMIGRAGLDQLVRRHRAVLATIDRGFYLSNFDRVVRALRLGDETGV